MCGGQHWTKMKYSSPTRLALDPCELKFHKRIARGAFGSVYLATDPNGYKYAVKRSRKFGTKRSRELINLGLCKDAANIMQYMGTFYTRNRNGILMQNSLFEHVPYNLRSFIRHMRGNMESHCERINAITPDNPSHAAAQVTGTKDYLILRVLCDVVNGILELHGRDLVHRDLKPDNILIDDDKSPTIAKICDLGSAKRITRLSMTARSDSDMTVEPSTPYVCSRWYRAPELLFGRTYYSVRYALHINLIVGIGRQLV
ncbi:Protein kinase GSK-3 domain family protein [Babesia bovis T2Bo]|uniref:Protein kinase GSK-3 domain family protein n=1 Tax=Babesia bovis T2Bo TaxID=484906 RepID=UPI001C34C11C|nr:Protein kinase GSK-3 domain family protein [Babesia bovis T2Bo]KAG6440157.1 Protein kinase GSK-3 domain family protein [Babesia bovis T2Bo]